MALTLKGLISKAVDFGDGKKISFPMVWTFHRDKYFESDGNGDFIQKNVLAPLGFDWIMNLEIESDDDDLKQIVFDLIANYEQDDRSSNVIVKEWKNDPNVERL